jgi:hypothetical protein
VKCEAGDNPMRSLAFTTHQNANKLTQVNLGSSTSTQPPQSQTKSIKTAGKSNSESYKRNSKKRLQQHFNKRTIRSSS